MAMTTSLLKHHDLAVKAALYSKFASIMGIDSHSSSEVENINQGIFQFPKSVALRVAAEKRGSNFLEFINFFRTSAKFSWERNRSTLSRRGMWINGSSGDRKAINVKAVPIDLGYTCWFWSVDQDKIYEVMEEYAFWQQDSPKVTLTYLDDEDNEYEMVPDIHLGEIVDESTIGEKFQRGQIFVFRMPITVDGWALKTSKTSTFTKIKVTYYDGDELTSYTSIIGTPPSDTELEAALRYFRRSVYEIYAVDLEDNSLGIEGSFAEDFVVGDEITVYGSTANNAPYTVVSATYISGVTTVVLSEALSDDTVDGTIYK